MSQFTLENINTCLIKKRRVNSNCKLPAIDHVFNTKEAVVQRCSTKKGVLRNFAKTLVPEPLF